MHSLSRRDLLVGAGSLFSATALLSAPRSAGAFLTEVTAATASAPGAATAASAGQLTIGGDLRVNRMGYGAMRITGPGIWGNPSDPAAAKRLLQRAVALGVNFIDTADAYGPDVSEILIAEALHPYPKGLVIATKGGLKRPTQPEWTNDGRPQHLRTACEASLRKLKLQRIDLYQLHAVDPAVPLEDSLGELAKLQKEGKIRHIGVSNFEVSELERAAKVVKVVSVQNRYNVADRRSEDVVQYCARHGIAFIPWAPLAQRQQSAGEENPQIAALSALAKQRGITVTQAALGWLLARSPVMFPIPGTSSIGHLEENVAAAAVRLSPADM